MKKIFLSISLICLFVAGKAQETVYPAPKQSKTVVITNATVHVGDGRVLDNTSIVITDGKISMIGPNVAPPVVQKS
jgi:imidazolonepropionase-like amidohydrolase